MKGATILFDQEPWDGHMDPVYEQNDPDRYLKLAGQLCAEHGITIIEAPVGTKAHPQLQEQLTAAQYAPVVDLQNQGYSVNLPERQRAADYEANTISAAKAIRKADPDVIILAGIAPSSGNQVPLTAPQMFAEWQAVAPYVDGAWVNANKWAGAPGCAPEGCPAVVDAFLADVEATPGTGE